jgi:hypothetical protein
MLPANFPPYPPVTLIALMFAVSFVFGLGYNWFFRWAKIPVEWAVVIGTMATIAILYGFFWSNELRGEQWVLLMLIAFAGSGSPMAIGTIKVRNASHKRKTITGAAARMRDEAVMDLTVLAGKIDKAEHVRNLYQIIGTLNAL